MTHKARIRQLRERASRGLPLFPRGERVLVTDRPPADRDGRSGPGSTRPRRQSA